MKINMVIEIESTQEVTQEVTQEELKSVEGMTRKEVEEFLFPRIPVVEKYVREELLLDEEDAVRIKLSLEEAE